MRVFGLQAGFARLAKYSRVDSKMLSEKAQFKWQVLELPACSRQGCVGLENVALVCEHYRISRATLSRWKAQCNPRHAGALEERSRQPGRTRVPRYSTQLQRRVIERRCGCRGPTAARLPTGHGNRRARGGATRG